MIEYGNLPTQRWRKISPVISWKDYNPDKQHVGIECHSKTHVGIECHSKTHVGIEWYSKTHVGIEWHSNLHERKVLR
jgi:hypothetical protein